MRYLFHSSFHLPRNQILLGSRRYKQEERDILALPAGVEGSSFRGQKLGFRVCLSHWQTAIRLFFSSCFYSEFRLFLGFSLFISLIDYDWE